MMNKNLVNSQSRLFPKGKDIPNIQDYPFPRIGKYRRVASICFKGIAVSASVGFSGNRAYRSQDYTEYRDGLGWLIKEQVGGEWDTHRYTFGVRVRFFLHNKRKIDIDNLIKPVLDAGTRIVWADDNQVVELYSIVLRDDPDPRVEVLIYTISNFVDYHHTCTNCGKVFVRKGLTQKFCSPECYREYRYQGSEKKCEYCGKVFKTGRSNNERRGRRFCSITCSNKGRRKATYTDKDETIITVQEIE